MGSGIPASSSAGPQATPSSAGPYATPTALMKSFRHSFMKVIGKDSLGDPKVTSDNFLDFEVGELRSMLDDKNREFIESREQKSQLKNLIDDRNREVRGSRDHETILNGLLVKTLDEVGHLKNLLDNKNLQLRESREQGKILKGLLDERDTADAASQNKSVRLETQLSLMKQPLFLNLRKRNATRLAG
jgi:hypothetical protein